MDVWDWLWMTPTMLLVWTAPVALAAWLAVRLTHRRPE
jgi:hypothetical protein